jgi:hypothetical protein
LKYRPEINIFVIEVVVLLDPPALAERYIRIPVWIQLFHFNLTMMSKPFKTVSKFIPLIFILTALISCSQEDVGISMEGMAVDILEPQENFNVGDSIGFTGVLYASDTSTDLTQLHARWISDKDGIFFEQRLNKNGYSIFKTNRLSRDIHEITFEVTNGNGASVQKTITFQNMIHLTARGTGYGNRVEWTLPGMSAKNFKLYHAAIPNELKSQLPILSFTEQGETFFMDTTARLNDVRYYQLEAEVDGNLVYSNIAYSSPGTGFAVDYPLMKVIFDAKRNFAYGIVSPNSRYDENKTGYGLVFINTTTMKPEKRILENIRFNDLDIDPAGDRLYVSHRNRKIYVIDLDKKEMTETIDLPNYIRKLEVGSNNRLYFHVDLASNNNYEFRILDLVTKTELPFKYSGAAGGSFNTGDIDLDSNTNTLYFSGPAKISTSFDIFSDMVGVNCCNAGEPVVYRNGKVFINHQLFDKDLVFLGNFLDEQGREEQIFDCNAEGSLAVGWKNLFHVSDRSIRKNIPAYFDRALFLNEDRLMLIVNSNSEYQRHTAVVYIYPFAKR